MAVAGAVEVPVNFFIWRAFSAADELVKEDCPPESAVRPFDRNRKGYTFGEGGALFVIEEKEKAEKRGAKIYGKVADFAQCTENVNMVFSPERNGSTWSELIRKVVRNENIDYINAHAPGSPLLDALEAKALHMAFDDRLKSIPVSSIKGRWVAGLRA